MRREQLMTELRCLVRRVIASRHRGDLHAHKLREQAYLDGYTRALCDAGVLTADEALQLILQERAGRGRESLPTSQAA
jgi:hypothetical protein